MPPPTGALDASLENEGSDVREGQAKGTNRAAYSHSLNSSVENKGPVEPRPDHPPRESPGQGGTQSRSGHTHLPWSALRSSRAFRTCLRICASRSTSSETCSTKDGHTMAEPWSLDNPVNMAVSSIRPAKVTAGCDLELPLALS